MNSVQQFTTSSRASLATRTLGRVSLIILLIAALGIVRSSSLPDEDMNKNYHRRITLEEVAALVNMSVPSFARFIRARTGFSFVNCLNNIRVGSAARLLIDEPSETIASIAYRCGFNNLSNFNRIFKAKRGITPKEFRSYYKKNKIII